MIIYFFLRTNIFHTWAGHEPSLNLFIVSEGTMKESDMAHSRVGWAMWGAQRSVCGNGTSEHWGEGRVFSTCLLSILFWSYLHLRLLAPHPPLDLCIGELAIDLVEISYHCLPFSDVSQAAPKPQGIHCLASPSWVTMRSAPRPLLGHRGISLSIMDVNWAT